MDALLVRRHAAAPLPGRVTNYFYLLSLSSRVWAPPRRLKQRLPEEGLKFGTIRPCPLRTPSFARRRRGLGLLLFLWPGERPVKAAFSPPSIPAQ